MKHLLTKNVATSLFFLMLLPMTMKAQKMPRALLITGNGNEPVLKVGYPPWKHEFQNQQVVQILESVVKVDTTDDLNLLRKEILDNYDLIISNSLFLTPGQTQLDALYRFVEEGKSFLTLHCGLLSFLNWEKYEHFLGGIFIGGPSSEPESFKVFTENKEFWGYNYSFRKASEHPVSKVVDDFTISDELYYFQPSSSIEVIARAENHPVMWWHPVGNGKVMSLTLGHNEAAKNNDGYKQLLINGVKWLTGIPLIDAKNPKPISNRSLVYTNFVKVNALTYLNRDDSITFEVENNNKDLYEINLDSNGKWTINLTGKTGNGKTSLIAKDAQGRYSFKDLLIKVLNDGDGNIASYEGNVISVSSTENSSSLFDAKNIIDGDLTTRWSSAPNDSISVTIDLTKVYKLQKAVLHWEAAFAKDYQVLVSKTGNNWLPVVDITAGDGETDLHLFKPVEARYIKVLGTKRAPGKWGYSLYEIEIFQQ